MLVRRRRLLLVDVEPPLFGPNPTSYAATSNGRVIPVANGPKTFSGRFRWLRSPATKQSSRKISASAPQPRRLGMPDALVARPSFVFGLAKIRAGWHLVRYLSFDGGYLNRRTRVIRKFDSMNKGIKGLSEFLHDI